MSSKGLLVLGFFIFCSIGALFLPHLGIYGYVADYCISPADQWYGRPLAKMGIRFSFFLALTTMVGAILQRKKLKFGDSLFCRHEVYIIVFLVLVWLSYFVNPETVGRYTYTDHPTIKLTKIIIFSFLLTHIITDIKKISYLYWVLIMVSTILAIKAYNIPYSRFVGGRLEGLGGADFSDSNRFAGFMVGIVFLVGIQFLRSEFRGRLVCLVSGAFIANSLMLARSRGALLGLAAGMFFAGILAPKKYRLKILLLLFVACMGVFYLADDQVLHRMDSITISDELRDSSAQTRLEIWSGGMKMASANPLLGVGPGNFYTNIERYQPKHPGRDAHNTLIRCAGEIGFLGVGCFALILYSSFKLLFSCLRDSKNLPEDVSNDVLWLSYGSILALVAVLVYGMTGTLLYTEYLWWFLVFPVSIRRALDNELASVQLIDEVKPVF